MHLLTTAMRPETSTTSMRTSFGPTDHFGLTLAAPNFPCEPHPFRPAGHHTGRGLHFTSEGSMSMCGNGRPQAVFDGWMTMLTFGHRWMQRPCSAQCCPVQRRFRARPGLSRTIPTIYHSEEPAATQTDDHAASAA